jgi:hypothetical protein
MEVTDNTKTLANALIEIDQLRQKLESAEAEKREFQDLYLLLNPSAVELPDAVTLEIAIKSVLDDLKTSQQIIREAREQKPVEWQYLSTFGVWSWFANEKHKNDTIEDGRWPIRALYLSPVPAMPIQDDIKQKLEHVADGLTNQAGNAKLREDAYDQGYLLAIREEVCEVIDLLFPQSEVKPSC